MSTLHADTHHTMDVSGTPRGQAYIHDGIEVVGEGKGRARGVKEVQMRTGERENETGTELEGGRKGGSVAGRAAYMSCLFPLICNGNMLMSLARHSA